MINKLVIFYLFLVYLFSTFPIQAQDKHTYPIYPLDRSYRKDEFRRYSGYNNKDYMMAAFKYFIGILEVKTPKGYPYCTCNPQFSLIFNPNFKSGYPADGIGFQYDWQAYGDGNGGCIKKNFSLYGAIPNSIKDVVERVEKRNNISPYYEPLSFNTPSVFNGGVAFGVSYSSIINYGCDLVEVKEENNNCSNFTIRGLPIVRGTIRCRLEKLTYNKVI